MTKRGQRGMGPTDGEPQVTPLPGESQSAKVERRRALTCRCCGVAVQAPDDVRLIAPGLKRRRK